MEVKHQRCFGAFEGCHRLSSYRQAANDASSAALEKLLDRAIEIQKAGDINAAYEDAFIELCAAADDKLFTRVRLVLKGLKKFSTRDFERLVRAEQEAQLDPSDASVNETWKILLKASEKGVIRSSLENAMVALRHAPDWEEVLGFDEFSYRITKRKLPPFKIAKVGSWTDDDDILACEWMQKNGINVNVATTSHAVQAVCSEHPFHPVRDYLRSLTWDQQPRISRWLTDYLGVEWSEYTSAVGRKWLISAIARVMNPGCQVDTCLILESPEQGLRKSTFLKSLCPNPDWFTDQLGDLEKANESSSDLVGKWIIEFSEVERFSTKHESGVLKQFISRQVDHYRQSYARRSTDFPRHCVFSGSTNKTQYLIDETGGRRYWPVVCTTIDLDAARRDRDQLWAEAMQLYQDQLLDNTTNQWWFEPDDPLLPGVRDEQAARMKTDPWDEKVWNFIEFAEQQYLDSEDGLHGFAISLKRPPIAYSVSVSEIMERCLNKKAEGWTSADQTRISAILTLHGMERKLVKAINLNTGEIIRDAKGNVAYTLRYQRRV